MKRSLIVLSLIGFSVAAQAQLPEDILKYTWQPVNGTARSNAIGGAMGALGGDLSALHTNPAGLGLFKTTDVVISPGFSFLSNKADFRGTDSRSNDKHFNLGTTGIVGGLQANRPNWTSRAIAFGVTRTANFSNRVFYSGQNDFSSQAEQYALEAANSGLTLDEMPFSSQVSYGTRLAAYNYVIDAGTPIGATGPEVLSMSMYGSLVNGRDFLVNQSQLIETGGGITELSFGYAGNMNDQFYIGASLGVPIVRYEKQTTFREEDALDVRDNFTFNEVRENFTTRGFGVNLKLGAIAKAGDQLRVGLTVHTPTWYSFTDNYNASMLTDLDTFRSSPGALLVTLADVLNDGEVPQYRYEASTPWKFMVSGAFVLNEVSDVQMQKGFITADIEYVTHKSARYRNSEDYSDDGYYDAVNAVMKDYYKNAFNFRVGGELKFAPFMTRLGVQYYGNPYADPELNGQRTFLSGGVGWRNRGMYIDLTYVHEMQKDINFPYRLSDKANTFANTRMMGSNLMLTLGFKI